MENSDHLGISPAPAGSGWNGRIRAWALESGFDAAGVAVARVGEAVAGLQAWLAAGFHGGMDYMAKHAELRADPALILPGCRSVVMVRMNYRSAAVAPAGAVLQDPQAGFISRYALGRDYHKVLRRRLARLGERISAESGAACRPFVDSAPVMEVEFAARTGLGWRGKHTLLLSREAGSAFFLGGLLTTLELEEEPAARGHCGACRACLDACPTGAIVAPYRVDARLCISYLSIELHGPIPEALRPAMGNRIYGCDDCQLACPWNRFAQLSAEPDFRARHGLDQPRLAELLAWSEADFAARTAGSAIHRIGHERWLRNVAVALGNGPRSRAALAALAARRDDPSALVREHVAWAWARLGGDEALPEA